MTLKSGLDSESQFVTGEERADFGEPNISTCSTRAPLRALPDRSPHPQRVAAAPHDARGVVTLGVSLHPRQPPLGRGPWQVIRKGQSRVYALPAPQRRARTLISGRLGGARTRPCSRFAFRRCVPRAGLRRSNSRSGQSNSCRAAPTLTIRTGAPMASAIRSKHSENRKIGFVPEIPLTASAAEYRAGLQ
jgi:hypothetical protein